MGVLYGVSVGPGNPELMTLQAVRTLEKCRVIAVPRTKGESTLALSIAEKTADMSGKEIIYLDFLMTSDKEKLNENYDRISEMLCRYLETEDVAMLNLGDISVYSTFSYIAERVEKSGFKVKWCAGVTSFCASACAVGKPLVSKNETLTIIPYGCDNMTEKINSDGTRVIMKSGKNIGKMIDILSENGILENTVSVENCGLENERISYGTDIDDKTGYFTVLIVSDSNE